jgi:hypothetical protein
MEKQTVIKKRMITGGDSLADDLIDWAKKMKMLSTVNTLAHCGGICSPRSSFLQQYAELIEKVVNKTIGNVNGWGGKC